MSKSNKKTANARFLRNKKKHLSITLSRAQLDLPREIAYITRLAQASDARIVKYRSFVFFSTRTRDAWVLDAEDDFAACVCRDGEPQPFPMGETSSQIAIDWQMEFAIEGERFIVFDKAGQAQEILGYPTGEIAAACGR